MLRSYLLPFGLIVVLLAGWEYSKPSYPVSDANANIAKDHGPPPPNNANEKIFQDHRRSLRRSALKRLERPWADHCRVEGRKQLADSVREYFYHRGNQEQSYPARWGDTGRTYIQSEWSITDDKRIEQLIQNLYQLGYLDPKALDSTSVTRIATIVKGLSVTQQPCKD